MNEDNTQEIRALIAAAREVIRFWQATCDAHPEPRQSWEDRRCFYTLAEALSAVGDA